jgi:hypothetical protein
MSLRHPARLAWVTGGLALALAAAGFLFMGLNRLRADPIVFGFWLEQAGLAISFPTVGALIAARRPRNPIGWIFIAAGLSSAATFATSEYALYTLFAEPHALPGGIAAAWISAWVGTFAFGLVFTFLFLLFPDGRLLSRRWRPVAWLAIASLSTVMVATALRPTLGDETGEPVPNGAPETVANPVGIAGADSSLAAVESAAIVVFVLFCALPAVASLVLRFRRSQGVLRQQIKWLAYAGAALAIGSFVVPDVLSAIWGETRAVEAISSVTEAATIVAIPVATAIAILRYRLYDLGLVVRRTLVYGTLTAALVASYLALVLLLQQVLDPESDFAIAGSTLAVAALFRPLRTRIQRLVDQRFNRSGYDAGRTLDEFGARLRDEVDLDTLGADLRGVVTDTMQPAHVSLWLREARP